MMNVRGIKERRRGGRKRKLNEAKRDEENDKGWKWGKIGEKKGEREGTVTHQEERNKNMREGETGTRMMRRDALGN